MKKTIVISLATVVCLVSILIGAEEKKAAKPLRVGVYDSRAVAVAAVPSSAIVKEMQSKMGEMQKAKAAGDTKKINELENWGQQQQQRLHLMGFGTAPVRKLLEPVKDKLSQVAQEAGVDIIVSKWQIDYQVKDAEFVDVTDAIVKLYNPDERAIKSIESMKNVKPMDEDEVVKIKD